MSELLDHAITVGDVLYVLLGWLTVSVLRFLRSVIIVERSSDGGAMSRRLRAEEHARTTRPHDPTTTKEP